MVQPMSDDAIVNPLETDVDVQVAFLAWRAASGASTSAPATLGLPRIRIVLRAARNAGGNWSGRAGDHRDSDGSEPEPARSPGCAELLLLGGVLARRVAALRFRRRAAEEVDLDLADEPVAELGVADARPSVRRR